MLKLIFLFAFSDFDVIQQARLDQNEAIATGNADRAAQYWTDDVTLRRGLGAAVSGKEAYRSLVAGENSYIYVRIPDEIEVSSDWPLAFESGTWTALRDGNPAITGRYSAQWVKENEKWLIRSEIFVALKLNQ